jgi:FtsP/CotA-like multicopper oxidase with cupredoxin domain
MVPSVLLFLIFGAWAGDYGYGYGGADSSASDSSSSGDSSADYVYYDDSDSSDDDACDKDFEYHRNFGIDADRVYYIACIDAYWNYAPTGYNVNTGKKIHKNTAEAVWLVGDETTRIGPEYIKALYVEYEDSCFDKIKPRSREDKHLGAIGPYIRALTGDTIQIFFKNKCSIPVSMHPHGVQYEKDSEGAPYYDGSASGDKIGSGDTYIYKWYARENLVDYGQSSKMWLYHSHVDEPRDVHAGLVGPIVITKKGMERSEYDLRPKDIDREFATFMVLYNENKSPYFHDNINYYLTKRTSSDDELASGDQGHPHMHTIHHGNEHHHTDSSAGSFGEYKSFSDSEYVRSTSSAYSSSGPGSNSHETFSSVGKKQGKKGHTDTNHNHYDSSSDDTFPDYMLYADPAFVESNLMHSINGYVFGNLHLDAGYGERVRWYTASFGTEGDGPHSPHWHGNIVEYSSGYATDTVVLIPGTTETVTMTVDTPGRWLYHCHVHDHIDAGMTTTFKISAKDSSSSSGGSGGGYTPKYKSWSSSGNGGGAVY